MRKLLVALAVVFAPLVVACASSTPNVRPTVAFATQIPADPLPVPPSCAGLPDDVRRTSLFARKEDVMGVESVRGEHRIGARNRIEILRGARVVVAASPTTTAPWLQRVARCHVDTYAASGHSAGDEPLSVPGATVAVRAVDSGYAVDITSDSWDAAKEIRARAESLRAR